MTLLTYCIWWVMRDSNSRPSRCKRVSYLANLAFLRLTGRDYTSFYPKQPKKAQNLQPNLRSSVLLFILAISSPARAESDYGATLNASVDAQCCVASQDNDNDDGDDE